MEFKTVLPVVLRYIVSAVGTILVTRGVLAEEHVATLVEQSIVVGGALMAIAPVLWAAWNRPSAKALEAAKQIDAQVPAEAAVIIKTPEGQPDIQIPAKP